MKIRSITQLNQASCHPCPWPTCPEPVKECQSITVPVCGVQIPFDPSLDPEDSRYVPKEDRCKWFKRVTNEYNETLTFLGPFESGESSSGSQTQKDTCVLDYAWKTIPPGEPGGFPERECEPGVSTTFELSASYAAYVGMIKQYDFAATGGSSSSPTSPCSGSITYTTTYPGEEPEVDGPNPITLCECVPGPDISNPAIVYEDGKFTLSGTNPNPPFDTTSWTLSVAYSEQVVLADLVAEITARAALYGTTHDWPGSACNSSVTYTYGYEDDDPAPDAEPICTQVTEATKARYRYTIPAGWYPGRSVFDVTWDEYFFPAVWDEWDAKVEAYEAWEVAHAAWVSSGGAGPEPVEPEAPGAEPDDKPELIAEREWEWDGTDTNDHSEWFVMDLPEVGSVPGTTRTVNLAVNCWKSTRYGRKPTWHGEIYVPSETP